MIFFDTKSEFTIRRQSYINFWDPSRKVMTLTAAVNGPRAVFRPIPQLAIRRSPALLVTVNRSGAAVSGRNVFVSGPGTLGFGISTDGSGRAYFRLPLSGKYTVSCDAVRAEVTLRPAWLGEAGWDYLDRLELDLDTGRSRFRHGVSSPLKTDAVSGGEEPDGTKKHGFCRSRRRRGADAGNADPAMADCGTVSE